VQRNSLLKFKKELNIAKLFFSLKAKENIVPFKVLTPKGDLVIIRMKDVISH
jgi:hypothetical protein